MPSIGRSNTESEGASQWSKAQQTVVDDLEVNVGNVFGSWYLDRSCCVGGSRDNRIPAMMNPSNIGLQHVRYLDVEHAKMDDSDVLDDTLYLLNTSSRQWSRASPPGPRPPGRYGHTLNILGSKIYIFCGQVEGYFFNDLLAFDLNALQNPTKQWEFLMPNTADEEHPVSPRPAPRTNHTIISYNDQMYL